MALPVPADRPFLSDKWAFNERADVAALWRLLASWEHHAFSYDLHRTPSDGVAPNPTTGAFVQATDNAVGNSQRKLLGEFFVPPSLTFAHRLEVWIHGSVSGAGSAGATVSFISRATGRVEKVTVVNASMGGVIGWVQAFVQASPFDVVEVWLEHNSASDATTVTVRGICAWWEPLDGLRSDVTIDTTADALSQTYFDAADVPDSTYQLRWLIRRANQYAGHRPRAVYTKWFNPVSATSTPGLGLVTTPSFYKVYVGDRINNFQVNVLLKRSAAGAGITQADVYWDGGLKGSTATLGWSSVAFTTGLTRGLHELRVDAAANDNASGVTAIAWVNGVTCFELPVGNPALDGLPLATGDTQPGLNDFQTIRDEFFASGLPMRRDLAPGSRPAGRKALVRNMYWAWRWRYYRTLVNDCRYHDGPTGAGYNISNVHAADVMASYRLHSEFSGGNPPTTVQHYAHALRTSIAGRTAPTAFDIKAVSPSATRQIPVDGTTKRVGGMGSLVPVTLHWHQPPIDALSLTTGGFFTDMDTLSVSDAQTKNHGRSAGAAFAVVGPLALP